ncbi:MAG: hypothetical protein WA654_11870, partial [Candidatus Sulfotelmatobacter sp.]
TEALEQDNWTMVSAILLYRLADEHVAGCSPKQMKRFLIKSSEQWGVLSRLSAFKQGFEPTHVGQR